MNEKNINGIPVMGTFDLVVAGGTSGGVAAALAAAKKGLKALVIAPETYFGEDICATGRIVKPEGGPSTPLFEKLYPKKIVEPLAVKSTLEQELLSAGVSFEFCSAAVGLVKDAKGVAGVLFSGKGGAFIALTRTVIDATASAVLARLEGVPFTKWPADAKVVASRVVIGPRPLDMCNAYEVADKLLYGKPPKGVTVEKLGDIEILSSVGKMNEWPVYRHSMEVSIPSFSPQSIADIEDELRKKTYRARMGWYAPRVDWLLQDHIDNGEYKCDSGATVDLAACKTNINGLYVIGTAIAISRADAEKLRNADHQIALGVRLGETLAPAGAITADACKAFSGTKEPLLHFQPRDFFRTPDLPRISLDALPDLPVIDDVDVVVVGGGTGGAPAAIAASREKAKTLLLESQHELGGIGTLGAINLYWYGSRNGFSAESALSPWSLCENDPLYQLDRWNAMHKSEWLRRQILKSGGRIWFGATSTGILLDGSKIRGVVVFTQWGAGIIKAKAVVDATGSADIAAAAGAECHELCDKSLSLQGSGLPPMPIPPAYFNTDYTFIDDTDPADVTRAMIVGRHRFRGHFDNSPIPGSRDRRQIVGDVQIMPEDVFLDRTWSDAICRSTSDFDRHGYPVDKLFHILPPPHVIAFYGDLPLRALLPKGISGVLVTGLAISCHRDAMPIYRMQADVQNEAFAAGIAATMAIEKDGEVRDINVRELQRRLVNVGNLLPASTIRQDSYAPSAETIAAIANEPLTELATVAALMVSPEHAHAPLRARLDDKSDPASQIVVSRLLAVAGDADGIKAIADRLKTEPWDEGLSFDQWKKTDLGGESSIDADIQVLAVAKASAAVDAVLQKAAELEEPTFSHIRAICDYVEVVRDKAFIPHLLRILNMPKIAGHDYHDIRLEMESMANPKAPRNNNDNDRNNAQRELYLARALYRCGDPEGIGEATLRRYADDIRTCYARFATNTLKSAY